jgi:GNAT superfamily N-acetyltransferase
VPVTNEHDLSDFDCGNAALNDWLKTHARRQEGISARTFVVCHGAVVVGYYSLSAGAVVHAGAPRRIRHNMPDPIPVMVLGRLAVDHKYQGRSFGKHLLKDAFARIIMISRNAGVRACIVHAIDQQAVKFYVPFGFKPFPRSGLTLYLPIETLIAGLE